LKDTSSEHAEVRTLLSALAGKVPECEEIFGEQAVGNTLFGLRGMSSEHDEVRLILHVLTPKISACEEILAVQAISNAL